MLGAYQPFLSLARKLELEHSLSCCGASVATYPFWLRHRECCVERIVYLERSDTPLNGGATVSCFNLNYAAGNSVFDCIVTTRPIKSCNDALRKVLSFLSHFCFPTMATKSTTDSVKKRAASSKRSPEDTYTDPTLREKLKQQIKAGDKGGAPGQWSARKSQLLTREYKKAGGDYKNRLPTEAQQRLHEWTEQEWQTADGQPAERGGGTTRYLPKQAWDELSPAQKKAANAKKQAGSRAGQQHVENTAAAKTARQRASKK